MLETAGSCIRRRDCASGSRDSTASTAVTCDIVLLGNLNLAWL